MGNWRTVNIVGTIHPADVEHLREHLTMDLNGDLSDAAFGPLSIVKPAPLCGLGDWPAPEVNACGNLAERDYTVHDVYDALWPLVAIAPSMNLRVHCGGEYESEKCVATITVKDGQVFEHEPEVASVRSTGMATMLGRLVEQVVRKP